MPIHCCPSSIFCHISTRRTFSDSHSVDSEPFVADLSVGAAVNYKNTKLAYALVYRTREFSEQEEAQVFGTLSLNWTF